MMMKYRYKAVDCFGDRVDKEISIENAVDLIKDKIYRTTWYFKIDPLFIHGYYITYTKDDGPERARFTIFINKDEPLWDGPLLRLRDRILSRPFQTRMKGWEDNWEWDIKHNPLYRSICNQ
jgi:hypothetical protein